MNTNTTVENTYPPVIQTLAGLPEDFAHVIDKDRRLAPNVERLPKDADSWQGFVHDAEVMARKLQLLPPVERLVGAFERLLTFGPHVVISTNVEDGNIEIWTTQMETETIQVDDCVAIGKNLHDAMQSLIP